MALETLTIRREGSPLDTALKTNTYPSGTPGKLTGVWLGRVVSFGLCGGAIRTSLPGLLIAIHVY